LQEEEVRRENFLFLKRKKRVLLEEELNMLGVGKRHP